MGNDLGLPGCRPAAAGMEAGPTRARVAQAVWGARLGWGQRLCRPAARGLAHLARLLSLSLTLLAGCPGDGFDIRGNPTGRPTATSSTAGTTPTPTGGSGFSGGVEGGGTSGARSPTPRATATPPAGQAWPSPTAPPSDPPRVAVRSVSVSPAAIVLYPVPDDESAGLGLPTRAALSGSSQRADGTTAGVRWVDRSGGQVAVDSSGAVSTTKTTAPGFYYVRAEAVDDPHVFQDVLVEVHSTGQLDMDVR